MRLYTCTYVHVQRPQEDVGCPPLSSSAFLSLGYSLSLYLGLAGFFAILSSRKSPVIPLFVQHPPMSSRVTGPCCYTQLFTKTSKIRQLGIHACTAVYLPQSHLPSPMSLYIIYLYISSFYLIKENIFVWQLKASSKILVSMMRAIWMVYWLYIRKRDSKELIWSEYTTLLIKDLLSFRLRIPVVLAWMKMAP